MKKRDSEEQIVRILGEAAKGDVAGICRRYGVSDATYYNWKKKYEGLSVTELRGLEEENRKLKRLLADSLLDNDA